MNNFEVDLMNVRPSFYQKIESTTSEEVQCKSVGTV